MQFSVMQTRVAEETGLSTTDDATKIKAWLNEAYKFVCALANWPWLLKNGTVQTVADITNLTASVNAAATAVTLSATHTPTLANDYMIRFDATSDDWYLITAHTAGTDALTISPAYVGSTNLSAGACTIRKVFYSLATDVDRIVGMRQAISDSKIENVSVQTFDRYLPDPTATGDPLYYAYMGLDSSKSHRITFYPTPSSKLNVQYRYYQRITELSGDSDTPLIPDPWHQVIIFVALAGFGHAYIDDDRIASAKERADVILKKMLDQISPVPDHLPVIQPWDRRRAYTRSIPNFPDNFPQSWY